MTETDINLYAMRHFLSLANTEPHIIGGRSNHSPLAEGAEYEAYRSSKLLSLPDIVVCSPAVRTVSTAKLTLAAMDCDLVPVVYDELQELDQGDWTGRERSEVYTPETKVLMERQGKDFRGPNGESMNDVEDRAHAWAAGPLGELVARSAARIEQRPVNVLLFGHGLWIKCFAARILGLDRESTFNLTIPNGSVSLFPKRQGSWTVDYLGNTPN